LNAQSEGNHLQPAELSTADQTAAVLQDVIPQQKAKIVGNRKVLSPLCHGVGYVEG